MGQKHDEIKDMTREWEVFRDAVMKSSESVYVVEKLNEKVSWREFE